MSIKVVIGKSFGDEGKGLAVDYFSSLARKAEKLCLVIRHNGGAQAGHTVDLKDKRFIFHQLSSGSFRLADTFWAETFMPDFYKLSDEISSFEQLSFKKPKIFSSAKCRCVTVDDVLINMALESSRGDKRHGSCGMGINEAAERSRNSQFNLTSEFIKSASAEALVKKLKTIRNEYLPYRLKEYNLSLEGIGEYGELLSNDNVLENVAEMMCRSAQSVEISDESFATGYDEVVFEGAQGLLLDENYLKFAPHLTTSRTGSYNPARFCEKYFSDRKVELIYVTRSYVTRHGAGPLPNEETPNFDVDDRTNIPNIWQGSLRYAQHGTPEDFVLPILQDKNSFKSDVDVSLMITHLNETGNCICSAMGNISLNEWLQSEEIKKNFSKFYISNSPLSDGVIEL